MSILSSSPVLGRSVVCVVDTGVTVVPVDAALDAAEDAVLLAEEAALELFEAALLDEADELADEDEVEEAASAALPSMV